VELEQRSQLVVGRFLDGADLGAAGVVHQHVDPAELLDRRVDRPPALTRVEHVQRDR
jgi:hypothetical protein